MAKYLFSKLLSKFMSDDKLMEMANSIVNSVINNANMPRETKSLVVTNIDDIMVIHKCRFVKLICNNVSMKRFEVLISDDGIISMVMSKSLFKKCSKRYSLYIKEI